MIVLRACCGSWPPGCLPHATARGGDIVLNFSDVPPGTLAVFSPYTSQGFTLTSTSGGFVFNPFNAGANGLAAFAPATITLTHTNGDPFSLLSIDLARNLEVQSGPPPPRSRARSLGGGTVTKTFNDIDDASAIRSSTTFDVGFTNVTSVSWDQPVFTQGLNQFTNIHLSTGAVPEPAVLDLTGPGDPAGPRLHAPLSTAVRDLGENAVGHHQVVLINRESFPNRASWRTSHRGLVRAGAAAAGFGSRNWKPASTSASRRLWWRRFPKHGSSRTDRQLAGGLGRDPGLDHQPLQVELKDRLVRVDRRRLPGWPDGRELAPGDRDHEHG